MNRQHVHEWAKEIFTKPRLPNSPPNSHKTAKFMKIFFFEKIPLGTRMAPVGTINHAQPSQVMGEALFCPILCKDFQAACGKVIAAFRSN